MSAVTFGNTSPLSPGQLFSAPGQLSQAYCPARTLAPASRSALGSRREVAMPPQDSGLISLRPMSSWETEAQNHPCVWAFASTGLNASSLPRLKLWFQSIPWTKGMALSVCTLKYSKYRESPPSLPKQACQVVFLHQKGQVRSHSPAGGWATWSFRLLPVTTGDYTLAKSQHKARLEWGSVVLRPGQTRGRRWPLFLWTIAPLVASRSFSQALNICLEEKAGVSWP